MPPTVEKTQDPLERRAQSPLWHRALERCREELEATEDYELVHEVDSFDDLLQHVSALRPSFSRRGSMIAFVNRLGPKFKFVDDFSAVIAICFGANAILTALVWGSVRLILALASRADDTLQNVQDMLEELSLVLQRFKVYEDTLQMDQGFETALVDVYSEVVCFYARAIHFFRTNPHLVLREHSWQEFRTDFTRAILRIKRMSWALENELDLSRMKANEGKYKEVLDLIEQLNASRHSSETVSHFHHLPFVINGKFWGRDEALETIKSVLNPDAATSVKSLSLYGMGGVGKSQLAMRYVQSSLDLYDVILWIAADNTITLNQSFGDIAQGLQLLDSDEDPKYRAAAMLKVKNWLSISKCNWLLIFDNADDKTTFRLAWPAGRRGSVLLTTRDANIASDLATRSLQVMPFDDNAGSEVLLRLIGLDEKNAAYREHARQISSIMGGLPLALSQIGGFINHRKVPLHEFLALYEHNSARIDARKTGLTNYDHTLSTVWSVSLARLPQDSSTLLNLLAFLDPDGIHEEILTEGSQQDLDGKFAFLNDRMDLGDAEEPLLQESLISKMDEKPILSVHRLMQSAVMRRITDRERSLFFDTAVKLLSWGLPDRWSQSVGHGFKAWAKCEKCLPHINHLAKQASKFNIVPENVQAYGELLLKCSWYLYEREMYTVCRTLVNAALETFEDKTTLPYASALNLSGLIDLDLNEPGKALQPFNAALEIRKARLGVEDVFIASSLNNIALAYTEMGALNEAYRIHEEAIDLRLRKDSERIGNSYSNMSSLLLRMDKPDEAEKVLAMCPSLKDFSDETFLSTGNPRFSGDMVLLSRIRLRQNRPDDALRLASKALAFRQKLLGNRLKTCDSMYDVASMLHKQNNSASAFELLTRLVEVAETLEEGEGQLARANYLLAVLYAERGAFRESAKCKDRALEIRNRLRPQSKDQPFDEDEFMKLCLWMLW